MIGGCAVESLPRVGCWNSWHLGRCFPGLSGGALVGVPQKDSWSAETGWFLGHLMLSKSSFCEAGQIGAVSETARHPGQQLFAVVKTKIYLAHRIGYHDTVWRR